MSFLGPANFNRAFIGVDVKIDKKTPIDDAGEVVETIERASSNIATTLRQLTQLGVATTQAFGGAINQTYMMGIEALLLAVEAATATAAARAAGAPGFELVTGRLALQIAAIGSLLITISLLEAGMARAAQQGQATVSMFRMLTFAR